MIDRFIEPARDEWKSLVQRASDDDSDIEASVRSILDAVRAQGTGLCLSSKQV
jgi:hypothetical protein